MDLSPQVGLEPTTYRLTADRSTTELLRTNICLLHRLPRPRPQSGAVRCGDPQSGEAWAEISIAFIFENFSYFIMHFFFLQYFQNFLKIEIVHSKYVLKTHFFVFHLRCLLYNFLHRTAFLEMEQSLNA